MNPLPKPKSPFTQASYEQSLARAPAPDHGRHPLLESVIQKVKAEDFQAAVEAIIDALDNDQLPDCVWAQILDIAVDLLEPASQALPADLKKMLLRGISRHLDPNSIERFSTPSL